MGEELKQLEDNLDEEGVWYCKSCLSLKIRNLDDDEDSPIPCYCDSCSSTNIGITDFNTWDKAYEKRYGFKFINKKK